MEEIKTNLDVDQILSDNLEAAGNLKENKPVSVNAKRPRAGWQYKFGSELANLFGGFMVIAIGFLFLVIISPIFGLGRFGGFTMYYLLGASAIGGFISFLLMLFFIEKAEEMKTYDLKKSGYVINKWRIYTMSTAGMPEDIISGLKRILKKKERVGDNPELLMQRPFKENAWLYQLGDLLGEARVIEYEDQLLKHTKTKI